MINHIPLSKAMIDNIFDNAKDQGDYTVALYRVAFPNLDNIASIDGYPSVSSETSTYIFEKAIAFDEIHHRDVLAGGAWMNRGFSSEKDIDNWHVVPCEYKEKA